MRCLELYHSTRGSTKLFDTEGMCGEKEKENDAADQEEKEDLCISFHLILCADFLAVIRVCLIL
jgi:hypothetical protein